MRVEVVFEREEVGNLDEVDDEDDGALITNLGVGGEEGRKLLEGQVEMTEILFNKPLMEDI